MEVEPRKAGILVVGILPEIEANEVSPLVAFEIGRIDLEEQSRFVVTDGQRLSGRTSYGLPTFDFDRPRVH